MSTSQKLNYTLESVNAIQQSLENKGAEITSTTPLGEYASIIDNLPSGGDEVESIALGTATNAQVGDKVLLNPATALQNPVELEYTKYILDSGYNRNSSKSYFVLGCMSSKKGRIIQSYEFQADVTFKYDEETNKFTGVQGGFGAKPLIWGTPDQLYYINSSGFTGTSIGFYNSETMAMTEVGKDPSMSLSSSVRCAVYKNHLIDYTSNYADWYEITDTGVRTIQTRMGYAYTWSLIPFNGKIYPVGCETWFLLGLPEGGYGNLTGFAAPKARDFASVTALDENGEYFIAGPYGSPLSAKVYHKTESTETSLTVEEIVELSNELSLSSDHSNEEMAIQVDPITSKKSFADIFIRFGVGELYYLQWDGSKLTNYGKIGDSQVYRFFFNPYDRILITDKRWSSDTAPDYHIYSFQGVMNKQFTVSEISTNNWSPQTLTGYVKSNEGQDEFGNTILKVNTTTDPNAEPWSDVGKLYGFNVSVEGGHSEESGGVTDITPVLTSNGTLGNTTSWAITANASYGASEPFFMLDGKSDGGSERGRWQVNDSDTENAWVKWSSPTPVKIETILVQNDEARYTVNQYEILGSNDNNDYVSLSSGTNTDRAEGSTWTIAVNSNDFYRYYQLKVTAFSDTSFPAIEIRSLTFYGSNE